MMPSQSHALLSQHSFKALGSGRYQLNNPPPPSRYGSCEAPACWNGAHAATAPQDLENQLYAAGHFTREERRELRHSEDIKSEARSQDTDPGLPKTKHGYTKDGFVDDTDSDLRSASSSSENDTESCALGSDASSDEPDEEQELRADTVSKLFKRVPELQVSSVEIEPIVIKRRTGRTRYMEMLLNHWLRIPPTLHAEDLCLFLKLLKLMPQECRNEIFSSLARGVQRRSQELYKFVFKCVKSYMPAQGDFFNAVHVKNKNKLNIDKLKGLPVSADKKKRPKPTVVKPVLKSIEDIADVTFRFLNEYKRYAHDHATNGYDHDSFFGCLTTDQQATICDMTKNSIASIEMLELESQVDLFRGLFGHKSSAAVIDELSTLDFVGDALSPAAWAAFKMRFQRVLNLAPREVRPPEAELARRFVYACPLKMLKIDVQARKPLSLAGAMDAILGRLNDHGFLRSIASKSLSASAPPRREQRLTEYRQRDQRQEIRERPRNNDIIAPPSSFPKQNQTPAQAQARTNHVAAGVESRLRARPPCERCRRTDGHNKDQCISKHDVEGKRLEPLEPSVYAKNKERYFILKDQIKAAIEEESSETSDETETSPRNLDDDYDDDNVDCVCSAHCDLIWSDCPDDDVPTSQLVGVELNPGPIKLIPKNVNGEMRMVWYPAPPPLDNVPQTRLVGIEPNPGPLSARNRRAIANAHRSAKNRYCNLEILAVILISKSASWSPKIQTDSIVSLPLSVLFVIPLLMAALSALYLYLFKAQTSVVVSKVNTIATYTASAALIAYCSFSIIFATLAIWHAVTTAEVQLFDPDGIHTIFNCTIEIPPAPRLVGIEINPGPDASSPYWMALFLLVIAFAFTVLGAKCNSLSDREQGNTNSCSATQRPLPAMNTPARCGRCSGVGHPINDCVSKRDLNGARVPHGIASSTHRACREASVLEHHNELPKASHAQRTPSAPIQQLPFHKFFQRLPFHHLLKNTITFASRFRDSLTFEQSRFYVFYMDDITVHGHTSAELEINIRRYYTCCRSLTDIDHQSRLLLLEQRQRGLVVEPQPVPNLPEQRQRGLVVEPHIRPNLPDNSRDRQRDQRQEIRDSCMHWWREQVLSKRTLAKDNIDRKCRLCTRLQSVDDIHSAAAREESSSSYPAPHQGVAIERLVTPDISESASQRSENSDSSDSVPSPRLVGIEMNPGPDDDTHPPRDPYEDDFHATKRAKPNHLCEQCTVPVAPHKPSFEERWRATNQEIFPIDLCDPPVPYTAPALLEHCLDDQPSPDTGHIGPTWQHFPGNSFWCGAFLRSLPPQLRDCYYFYHDDVRVFGCDE